MKKGFTLIELLIVIAILAILTTVLVLVINPAELFRQSRDSQRISDLATLNKAISYYLLTATNATLTSGAYTSGAFGACGFISGICPGTPRNNLLGVDGTGWVPLNLTLSTGGSPIPRLPQDPSITSSSTAYYVYGSNGSSYELEARLESSKYYSMQSTDGGGSAAWYEVGSLLTL